MPYFFILPCYLLVLVGLGIAAVGVRFVPSLRSTSGYMIGGALGTVPGFLLANILVTVAGLAPVWVSQRITPAEWLHQALKILVAAVLLIGPFVASLAGAAVGFAAGVYLVWRRRRKNMA